MTIKKHLGLGLSSFMCVWVFITAARAEVEAAPETVKAEAASDDGFEGDALLTGGWGGYRSKLYHHGIDINATEIAEFLAFHRYWCYSLAT